MNCRFCQHELTHLFVSLGSSPLANAFLTRERIRQAESFYPLDVYVCDRCFLVQLDPFELPERIFEDYAYFSSYSESWLEHAKSYARRMIESYGIGRESQVVEIASNDGYLLQYFAGEKIPVLGIEPAANVAEAAERKGIPTVVAFFGAETARRLKARGTSADLLIGNNVLAHVPDLNDFVQGMKILLRPRGLITLEFPHLVKLIEAVQFDTIYHEHHSYFSFLTVEKIFAAFGLTLFDVEELPTHGGSLRIYARHDEDTDRPVSERVGNLRNRERQSGFAGLDRYLSFQDRVHAAKREILKFFIEAREKGASIVGYGAAAKGNTLINFCGIKTDFMDYVVDRNPHKQGRFLPGSHIPVYEPTRVRETKPDYVVVLPWNIQEEIMAQMSYIQEWGGRFVVLIPEVRVM